MASTYFTRDLSGASRQTWTFSCWFKRSKLSTTQTLFSSGTSNTERSSIFIEDTTSTIRYYSSEGAAVAAWTASEAVLRDPSAWYHFVCKYDTTQATATDRIKFYLNGEAMVHQTGGITAYPAQNNASGYIGSNDTHGLGCLYYGTTATEYWDGYMAHVNFTDGTAYDASAFGETDTNGQWKPKTAPSVTYGTNGFFLKFASSGSLGTDSSGNGNDFTKNGSGDQVTDTPDNVFATINALQRNGGSTNTLSEGNLKQTSTVYSTANFATRPLTIQPQTGKWYFEAKYLLVAGAGNSSDFGVIPESKKLDDLNPGTTGGDGYGFRINAGNSNVQKYTNNTPSNITGTSSPSDGDIYSLAIDFDNGKLYGWQNGTEFNGQDISTETSLVTFGTSDKFNIYIMTGTNSTNDAGWQVNTGNPTFSITSGNTDDNGYGNFEYAPPSGYLALCTKNLVSELTLPIGDGSAYFHTQLYTGNNNTGQSITNDANAGDFQPDFLWLKDRSDVFNHYLTDSSRGNTKYLNSNNNGAETTNSNNITSFDSDGFTTGTDNAVNYLTDQYAVWQWKVNGGTTSSNTDGSITSTVQANTTAGFSIVTYTGTGSNATVGHGLGVVPDMVIVKNRSSSADWGVQMANTLGFTNALRLNLGDAYGGVNGAGWWNDIAPTSTTVSIGTRSEVNTNGNNYVMYCFNNVEGYSKFGKYTGNGSTDGTFVYTGFKPAWLIVKKSDGAEAWQLRDTTREPFNVTDLRIDPNSSNAEGGGTAGDQLDILSNGFKGRNGAGQFNGNNTYIYMAFAEHPFVDSTGRPVTAR